MNSKKYKKYSPKNYFLSESNRWLSALLLDESCLVSRHPGKVLQSVLRSRDDEQRNNYTEQRHTEPEKVGRAVAVGPFFFIINFIILFLLLVWRDLNLSCPLLPHPPPGTSHLQHLYTLIHNHTGIQIYIRYIIKYSDTLQNTFWIITNTNLSIHSLFRHLEKKKKKNRTQNQGITKFKNDKNEPKKKK